MNLSCLEHSETVPPCCMNVLHRTWKGFLFLVIMCLEVAVKLRRNNWNGFCSLVQVVRLVHKGQNCVKSLDAPTGANKVASVGEIEHYVGINNAISVIMTTKGVSQSLPAVKRIMKMITTATRDWKRDQIPRWPCFIKLFLRSIVFLWAFHITEKIENVHEL